jgi:hypothetical protein
MNKLIIIALPMVLMTSVNATEYNSERFKKDIDVLIPLASQLKGKCLAEKDETACEQSDAIVRSLREIASKNSSGKTLSKDEQKKLIEMSVDVLQAGILDAIEDANSSK